MADERMELTDLFVTQPTLRYVNHLPAMIEHVKANGLWTVDILQEWAKAHGCTQTSPIQITRFEDGLFFLHDGHHRVVTTWIGGRRYLHASEYKITEMVYAQYGTVNFKVGWFTPYDPRKEMRYADIKPFKAQAKGMLVEYKDETQVVKWIHANRHKYCMPHPMMSVPDLAVDVEKLYFSWR